MIKLEYQGGKYELTPKGLETLFRLSKLRADVCEHDHDGEGVVLEVLILAILSQLAHEFEWKWDPHKERLLCADCGGGWRDHR